MTTTWDWNRILGTWSSGPGPGYRRLAAAIETAVARGDAPAGTRLPAERTLATSLGVSRTTVVAAYDLLREGALVESRQGSGTWVRHSAQRPTPTVQESDLSGSFRRNTLFRGLLEETGSTIEFLGAHLAAPDQLPDVVHEAEKELRELGRGSGYAALGLPSLRKAVAAHLTRSGLPTLEAQVLVTSGAEQAIGLAAALYLQRGDAVAVENPTYPGAIDVFTAAGGRLVPVPMGPDGVHVGRLREAVTRFGPKLIYLMSTFHNPTGTVLPEAGRREIARLAEDLQVPVVEDNTLADLVLGTAPPPSIAAFTRGGPVLAVGSMSKLFWGGLRVGWVRAPEPIITRLARFKVVADLGSSVVSQAVAVRFLARLREVQASRRRELTPRIERLARLLKKHLPDWSWTRPSGGLVVWARLPRGDANDLAQVALRHGVSILAGSACSPNGAFADYIRMPFTLDLPTLEEGVKRLARAWSAYERLTREPHRAVDVIV